MPREQGDLAVALVWEAAGVGCSERVRGERVCIDLWLPPSRAGDGSWLREALMAVGIEAEVTVAEEGAEWTESIARFHRPFGIASRLWIRPPWVPARASVEDVIIDPGMAFGTGQHATTRGCLELLAELDGGSLLDVGCGSGILAIAGRRLGFDPVWAVDSDPLAVDATIENARANGVGVRVGLRTIGRDPLPSADAVVANLTATVLRELAPALASPRPRHLVASGLRPDEIGDMVGVFDAAGFTVVRTVAADGWATILLGGRS